MTTIRTIWSEHIEWRGQILKLAKADLIKEYSGTALGWSWALIKPTLTILVFWFAFTYGLRGGGAVNGYPFILWMMPGFVAWFFMGDMITGGASAIRKYRYLVTKLKFPVSTIPTFVTLSTLVVHLLLVAIVMILYVVTGHYPDIFGLIASICNQFTGTSTFYDQDKKFVYMVNAENKHELHGDTFVGKVFCGTANWFWHCISDIAGSSGSRGKGEEHIGAGLPIPFTELFQLCDFGKFENEKGQWQSFATVMTKVYEEGYDARHAATMSVPVILNELLIRAIYTIKRHFYNGLEWNKILLENNHIISKIIKAKLIIRDISDITIISCLSFLIIIAV